MTFGRRRSSDCERHRQILSAHIDGRLSAGEEQALKAHLAGCPACAEELLALRHTVSMLGQLPRLPVPRSFLIEAPVPASRKTSTLYYLFRNATAAVAALLVALLAFGYVMQATLPAVISGTASSAPVRPAPVATEQHFSAQAKSETNATGSTAGEAAKAPPQAPMRDAAPKPSAATEAPAASSAAPAPLAAAPANPAASAPTAAAAGRRALSETSSSSAPAGAPSLPSSAPAVQGSATVPGAPSAAGVPATVGEEERSAATSWPLHEIEWALGIVLAALVIATLIARREVR